MTMHTIWSKLRKKNKKDYRQFTFCITFAVLLISSFLFMLFSPLILKTLPVGGDSRKQVFMILGIAVAGCILFIVYATGLFLRYKSREIGVFLALGSSKGTLMRAFLGELGKLVGLQSLIGLVGGVITAFALGKVFEWIAGDANSYSFGLSLQGVCYSVLYVAVLCLIVMVMAVRFMALSNVMEIVNQQRKQEPLKKMVTTRYLFAGLAMLITGVLLALVLPMVIASVFHHFLGGWTNLFYLLVLRGLYQVMVYSIAAHRRGRHPQRYYNHVISYGMLKFQGGSIVRNMLVIALLIMGSLFAMYYVPQKAIDTNNFDQYESKYGFQYLREASELTQGEVEVLAKDYGLEVQNYREGEMIAVVGDGTERVNVDDDGNLIEEYKEQLYSYECISAADFEYLTGQSVEVEPGTYYMIMRAGVQEDIFNRFGNMSKLYYADGSDAISMKYMGNVEYMSLVVDNGFDEHGRYILNDQDYELLKAGLPEESRSIQVLFDTPETEQAAAFSKELYRQFALRSSEHMNVINNYNAFEHQVQGSEYGYAREAMFDPDNAAGSTDWRYQPNFVYLLKANHLLSISIFLLLFSYVAVICLSAVGIISLTRSQSVAMSNRQVFGDLEKLGANRKYLRKLLHVQVKKVFVLPTVVGCAGMLGFELLILYMNDGRYQEKEFIGFATMTGVTLMVVLYQYVMYRISLKAQGRCCSYNSLHFISM